jgi:ribosome-binding factor A
MAGIMTVRKGERGPTQRQLRIGEELRHVLASVFEKGEIRDPGLGGLSVTVTEVRVGSDLRIGTAFVVPLGGGDAEAMLGALARARPFLRRRSDEEVRLKFVPDLVFRLDPSFDEAQRIEALLRDPAVARDLERPDEPGAGSDDDRAAGGGDGT